MKTGAILYSTADRARYRAALPISVILIGLLLGCSSPRVQTVQTLDRANLELYSPLQGDVHYDVDHQNRTIRSIKVWTGPVKGWVRFVPERRPSR